MPLRPGETFGRYQLAELLGQGAMGQVYSAYDTVLHRKVALKVLSGAADLGAASSSSSNGAARILREARAAAGITHPNAVSIYDIGEVDGVSFLAMELVAGSTLRRFIGDESIPLARRMRWITDVARALGAAHQLGLVHRDIKPENVMVRDDGFVKVLDFGIARRSLEAEAPVADAGPLDLVALEKLFVSQGTLTAEGVVVGTPMYMAPEQMRAEALDGRADQFAWGVLAYEVLTGKIPWTGDGLTLLAQILSQTVAPMTTSYPGIPAAVDLTIRRALMKSPADRFRVMEEIADSLEPFAASLGAVTARTEAAGSSTRDSAFAATEQVSVGSARMLMQSGAAARTAGIVAAERKTSRGRTAGLLGAGFAAIALLGGVALRRVMARSGGAHATADAGPTAEPSSRLSNNVDATAECRAGVQAFRDASLTASRRHLARAVELDPLFAQAHLRLALLKLVMTEPISSADFEPVRSVRASLSPQEQTLLDAFEPSALVPPDTRESRRRMESAVQRYPDDVDLLFYLAVARDNDSDPTKAVEALDTLVVRDPGFAVAWFAKGEVESEFDDVVAVRAAFASCVKVSPGAATCLGDLATLQANEGNCEALVDTSRKLVTLAPWSPIVYRRLAEGLLGSGQSLDAVRAALAQSWDHDEPARRPVSQLLAEAALGIFSGDFAGAERRYAEADKRVTEPDESIRFPLAYPQMLIALEVGRPVQVSTLADQFLRKRAGWALNPAEDQSIVVEAIELASGGLTRSGFDKLRNDWLARSGGVLPNLRWIHAYALPVQTGEDAVAALALKPGPQPLMTPLTSSPLLGEPIGRTYALAGRLDEAIPLLARTGSTCALLDGVAALYAMWATYDLGRAFEARGDRSGACEAYERVVARWGRATPTSRTATKAAERTRALRCAP